MRIELFAIEGRYQGKVFPLDPAKPSIEIGRLPGVDILLDDPRVSRRHARLLYTDGKLRIVDLGSRNGIVVNGQLYTAKAQPNGSPALSSEVSLNEGDTFRTGDTVFQIRRGSSSQASSPPSDPSSSPAASPSVSTSRSTKHSEGEETISLHPTIPGYTIESPIGYGGMGAVFKGRVQATGEIVAIKMIQTTGQTNPKILERFTREIEITRALQHPNIIAYRSHGFHEGFIYLVLQYIAGVNLEVLLSRRGGKLTLPEAVPIMRGVLDGMAYAHAQGFIHRDLKPANILLEETPQGWKPYIADLGLAKSFQTAGCLTMTGTVAGTCLFMPKEQLINFKYLKPVSDVFSLGATLYMMLTGNLVYDLTKCADPIGAVMGGHIVPLAKRGTDLPLPP